MNARGGKLNKWLIGAILFLLPFEACPYFTYKGLPLRPIQILLAVFVFINIPRIVRSRAQLVQNPWIFLIIFMLLALISFGFNNPSTAGLQQIALYGFEFALAIALSLTIDKSDLKRYRNIIILSGGMVAVFGLFQLLGDSLGLGTNITLLGSRYTHAVFGYPRIHGLSLEPAFYASYLFIPLGLALAAWLVERRAKFWWLSSGFAIIIALTTSRTAWLGLAMVFAMLTTGLIIQKRYREMLQPIGLALVCALSVLTMLGIVSNSQLLPKQDATTQTQFPIAESANTSTNSRLFAWRAAGKEFLAHPALGIGAHNSQLAIQQQMSPAQLAESGNSKANSLYLEILAEEGLLGAAALLAFFVGLVWLAWRRLKSNLVGEQKIWIAATVLVAPSILIGWGAVSNLAVTHTWVLVGILVSIVGTGKLQLIQKLQRWRWLRQNRLAVILLLAASAYYILFGLLLYRKFQFPMLDLGLFNRHMFGLVHGSVGANPLKGYNLLGDHSHFFLLWLAPLYHFWQDPKFLLAVQALCISLSGWPIYLIAKKYTKSSSIAALWLLPYYAYFGFWSALAYPFHDSAAAVLPLAWALYFLLVSKNYRHLLVSLAVLLLFREDMPLVALMAGVYIIVVERKYLLGVVISVLATLYFFWVTKIWLPLWGPSYGYTQTAFGSDLTAIARAAAEQPLEFVKTLFWPKEKLQTILAMLGSFGGLSLLALEIMILLLPLWLGRFLSIEAWRWSPLEHYSASQGPILAAAAIVGLARLLPYLKSRLAASELKLSLLIIGGVTAVAIAINVLVHQYGLFKPLYPGFYRLDALEQSARRASDLIPPEASLAASSAFASLSGREEIYNLPLPTGVWPEYIIASSELDYWPYQSADELISVKNTLIEQYNYLLIYDQAGTFVLKKTSD